jgi:ketopantoate hydroxymethyltransferase
MAQQRLLDLLGPQRAARVARPDRPRLKVNLYTALETRAAARAARTLAEEGRPPGVDCLMVGDSYLMTHLGRPGTRLDTPAEEAWALDLLVGLLAEVRQALDAEVWPCQPPWLLGDLPDGAAARLAAAEVAAGRMAAAGAEAVKVELAGPESWAVLEGLGAARHRGGGPPRLRAAEDPQPPLRRRPRRGR